MDSFKIAIRFNAWTTSGQFSHERDIYVLIEISPARFSTFQSQNQKGIRPKAQEKRKRTRMISYRHFFHYYRKNTSATALIFARSFYHNAPKAQHPHLEYHTAHYCSSYSFFVIRERLRIVSRMALLKTFWTCQPPADSREIRGW